jgi:hypothetical protein
MRGLFIKSGKRLQSHQFVYARHNAQLISERVAKAGGRDLHPIAIQQFHPRPFRFHSVGAGLRGVFLRIGIKINFRRRVSVLECASPLEDRAPLPGGNAAAASALDGWIWVRLPQVKPAFQTVQISTGQTIGKFHWPFFQSRKNPFQLFSSAIESCSGF